jgi:hypothetical protein
MRALLYGDVTYLKNAVFWDVTPRGYCKNYLLIAANVVPGLLILFSLMMEATCSSETSVR